jgi:hypothetical protein
VQYRDTIRVTDAIEIIAGSSRKASSREKQFPPTGGATRSVVRFDQ